MGPIAGLAAGLGIAALLSHFGLGEAFANGMMMLLLVLAVAALGFWLMRRLGRNKTATSGAGPFQPAYAGGLGSASQEPTPQSMNRQAQAPWNTAPGSAAASFASGAAAVGNTGPALPPDFDRAGFERLAKLIFIRLQAANDKADLNDLRRFTTPEMFASIRLDLQNRGDALQQTDVQQVDAEVIDLAQEGGMDIVSARYHGLIREEAHGSVMPFDEIWHLVKPQEGAGDWAIAGIQARS
jgi:predicted lipid-binding transport protein (Tim44 family)